ATKMQGAVPAGATSSSDPGFNTDDGRPMKKRVRFADNAMGPSGRKNPVTPVNIRPALRNRDRPERRRRLAQLNRPNMFALGVHLAAGSKMLAGGGFIHPDPHQRPDGL